MPEKKKKSPESVFEPPKKNHKNAFVFVRQRSLRECVSEDFFYVAIKAMLSSSIKKKCECEISQKYINFIKIYFSTLTPRKEKKQAEETAS